MPVGQVELSVMAVHQESAAGFHVHKHHLKEFALYLIAGIYDNNQK